jgi:hypothetical protein
MALFGAVVLLLIMFSETFSSENTDNYVYKTTLREEKQHIPHSYTTRAQIINNVLPQKISII